MSNPLNIPHWPTVRHALVVAWRHKHLWILGLLAVVADFGGIFEAVLKAVPAGEVGAGFAAAATRQPFGPWFGQHMPLADTWRSVLVLAAAPGVSAVVLAAVTGLLALTIAFVAFGFLAVAATALTVAVNAASTGREIRFGDAVHEALGSFWSALGLLVGMKLAVAVPFAVVASSWARLASEGGLVPTVTFLFAFVGAAIIGVISSLLAVIALNEIAVNRRPLPQALHWAARGLRRHWLAALELGALLLVVSAAVYLAALVAMMTLAVPIIFLIALFAWLKSALMVSLLVAATLVLIMLSMMVAAGFVGVAQLAAWNMYWQSLGHRTIFAHVFGWMRGLVSRLFRR